MGFQKWSLHLSSGLEYAQMSSQSQFKQKATKFDKILLKINTLWDDDPTQIHRKCIKLCCTKPFVEKVPMKKPF